MTNEQLEKQYLTLNTGCQMDFPHEPIWCSSCWNEKLQFKGIQALEEANRLKQTELNFRISGELDEVEPLPRPKQQVKFVEAVQKQVKTNSFTGFGFNETS